MLELAFGVFPDLKDHGVEPFTHPANRAMVNRKIRTIIEVIRVKENLLHFLETDSTLGVPPKAAALPLIEVEPHAGITVIPQKEMAASQFPVFSSGAAPFAFEGAGFSAAVSLQAARQV
jgi:hypothetical protein